MSRAASRTGIVLRDPLPWPDAVHMVRTAEASGYEAIFVPEIDALAAVAPGTQWVMIHDAARPLVTPAILAAGLISAQEHQATIAAVPVKDTIKLVQEGRVTATLDRSQLWAIQTPQVFSFPLIHQAHHNPAAQKEVTDDATLLEQLGHSVAIFPGAYSNIKITTQEDLFLAEAFIQGHKT